MLRISRATSSDSDDGQQLIALAQKLARDAEHHALLSESLASQADRLMLAGLRKLQANRQGSRTETPPKSC
jgi:hypothetical protein